MNIREIKDLINLMNEHGLAEIEIESDGTKIKLRRNNGNVVVERAGAPQTVSIPASARGGVEAPAAAAPAPDADAYIKVGAKVEVGQVVCIIEAMKLMNEIKSEVRGTVAEILVTNGDAVEFGQVLFSVV